MMNMELTERELEFIRSALCAKSIKTLCHAHEVEREEKEKGLSSEVSKIHYDVRDEIKAIIERIDQLKESK